MFGTEDTPLSFRNPSPVMDDAIMDEPAMEDTDMDHPVMGGAVTYDLTNFGSVAVYTAVSEAGQRSGDVITPMDVSTRGDGGDDLIAASHAIQKRKRSVNEPPFDSEVGLVSKVTFCQCTMGQFKSLWLRSDTMSSTSLETLVTLSLVLWVMLSYPAVSVRQQLMQHALSGMELTLMQAVDACCKILGCILVAFWLVVHGAGGSVGNAGTRPMSCHPSCQQSVFACAGFLHLANAGYLQVCNIAILCL